MTSKQKSNGAAMAASVAVLLLAGCASDDSDDKASGMEASLTCLGGNECAGMSECAGGPGMGSCEGMNECKGMGWSYVKSKAECDKAGGTIKADES
jgi:hypothetical protein